MADSRDVLPGDRLRAYATILLEYTKDRDPKVATVIAAEEKAAEENGD